MIWQDAVITSANVLFSISLVPQVYSGFKEKSGVIKFQTSIPTFVGLFVVAYALWSLDLRYSSAISIITGLLWFMLFIQRIIYKKDDSKQ